MSSGPGGWLPLIFTTLGAGALGSVIASYGSQARERRKARAEALAYLQRIEIARRRKPVRDGNDFDDRDIDELETRCMFAGIPRYLVDLYRLTNESGRYRGAAKDTPIGKLMADPELDEMKDLVRNELITRAAGLLASAVWHPWLTPPYRRWRAHSLRRSLFRTDEPTAWLQHNDRRVAREWESQLISLQRNRKLPRREEHSGGG